MTKPAVLGKLIDPEWASQEINRLNAEIERLRAALTECADDLAAELNVRYHKTLDYPSQRRAYDRDMVPVIEARKLLGLEQKAGEREYDPNVAPCDDAGAKP